MDTQVRDLLLTWAAERPDEVVFHPENGYYSANIVADAYKEGYEKGQVKGSENFVKANIRKVFVNKATLLLASIDQIMQSLRDKGYEVSKIFISHEIQQSKVLLAINPETHHNQEFIKIAYSLSSELQEKYHQNDLLLNIGFIDDTNDLNLDLLKTDGFEVAYDLTQKTPIE